MRAAGSGSPPWTSPRALGEVFADDGYLARKMVFAEKEVTVEASVQVFGHRPEVFDWLVTHAITDPERVPLIQVPGAREQQYSLASVLAREQAIANTVERLAQRGDAPAVPITESLARSEAKRVHQLAAAEAICGSGSGAELVIGVAGSLKTTMLEVVAESFEQVGCQVIGTGTSGQAARTLGHEAGIDESRNIASLVWRLDHDRLRLDSRTVVILDEGGMTDDLDMLRLAREKQHDLDQAQIARVWAIARRERTGLGDDRQGAAIDTQLARYRSLRFTAGAGL